MMRDREEEIVFAALNDVETPAYDILGAVTAARRERPGKRRPVRTVLLAAALACLLCVTALAVSPTLREALMAALGSFAPYRQDIEGLSVVDQGIEVKVVSALSDGNTVQVYFEVRDLTGNRLDENLSTDFWLSPPSTEQTRWTISTYYPAEVVHYDPETRTALLTARLIGGGPPATGLTLTADAHYFTPGHHDFRFDLPDLRLTTGEMASQVLESGETVLVPGQTPMALDTDLFSLSSYGFATDGRLHILYQCHVPVESAYLSTFLTSRLEEAEDMVGSQRTQSYNRDIQTTMFQRDGETYYDASYAVGPEAAEDIRPLTVYGSIVSGEPIDGLWEFEIPLEDAPTRTVSLEGSETNLMGVTAKTLSLTALGANIEADPHGTKWTLGYPLAVYLSDGTVLSAGDKDSTSYSGDYAVNHWTFPEPVEPENVTAIALGQWYIPLDGDTAQPGHWLKEVPTGQNP